MTFHLVDEELPVLTEVVAGELPPACELPVLTELVADDAAPAEPPAIEPAGFEPGALSGDEMVRLLQRLEVHLESVFAKKLNSQLEHLQRLAVDLAISEFKAELPQLLHDALIELRNPNSRR